MLHLQSKIRQRFPRIALSLRNSKFLWRRIAAFGRDYYCPVCRSHIRNWRFAPYGTTANLQCPVCFSLERHRLDWLFLSKHTDLLETRLRRFLHIAPESCLASKFQEIDHLHYFTGDLSALSAMLWFDLTAIPFQSCSFAAIYCSHVLEHIQDDRQALAELFRLLKPGGWAVLQVPITVEKTFEDPTVIDPVERERFFGQRDHVRRCGPDYVDRMRDAGFKAIMHSAREFITELDASYLGIQLSRFVIYCEKPRD